MDGPCGRGPRRRRADLALAPQTPIAAAASSRSASGNAISGLWPPSSKPICLTRLAAAAWMALPVATEPVNEIASSLRRDDPAPTTSPRPWTMLNTPTSPSSPARRGSPAPSAISNTADLGLGRVRRMRGTRDGLRLARAGGRVRAVPPRVGRFGTARALIADSRRGCAPEQGESGCITTSADA